MNQVQTPAVEAPAPTEVRSLRELSPQQWKSGIAAWLGWLFDGLDMHLYTLVALPFVAQLLSTGDSDPQVAEKSSWIQGAFLFGWALGGGFFGRIGDRIGRSRTLVLTILTYAVFTGLSFFAQTWWHLLIFRFVAALGIGGEWAVGASLLTETWPRHWRPWIAAVLQTAVNCGILLASVANAVLAGQPPRYVFLVGVLPAVIVLWIRRAVPEPEEWHAATSQAGHVQPGILDLFRGSVRRTTILTILVCGLSLTAHWAFMFWSVQHLRKHPDALSLERAARTELVSEIFAWNMVASIVGNFASALLARLFGYRLAIAVMSLGYALVMFGTYGSYRTLAELWWWIPAIGFFSGVFALFTMYLPPLFPTLLRTTGAGFCYNIGRIAAACGTIYFSRFASTGEGPGENDLRFALVIAGLLFLPTSVVAMFMPHPPDETRSDAGPLD